MTIQRKFIWRTFTFIGLVFLFLLATSQVASQIVTQADEKIDANGTLIDMSFFAGDEVKVAVNSSDDVFVAGGKVTANATQADHLIMAGGELILTGINVHDAYIAGGEVEARDGAIEDDLVAAGGQIILSSEFSIGGSAVVTGGDVKIETPIGGDLRVAAGDIYLNSQVTGDVQLMGDDVELGPDAKIGGDLKYRAKELNVSPSAVITGSTTELAPHEHADFERWGRNGAAMAAVSGLAFLLGIAVLVIAIAGGLPALMNSSTRMIREKPLQTLGIGFLITVVGPACLFFLFASVIGIPLALLIGLIFLAVAPIAIAATTYFVGMEGRRRLAKKQDSLPSLADRLLWSLGAFAGLIVLGAIPFIGGVLWIIVFVFGVGAVMAQGGKALAYAA
jgi:cytoskeletal protein CcmA (bactofilin family)